MKRVYRILTQDEWLEAKRVGALHPNALDTASGFMHLSAHDEVLETARRYFPPSANPVAVALDIQGLGPALRWETVATREGVAFPHYYQHPIPMSLATRVICLSFNETTGYAWGSPVSLDADTPERQ